MFNKKIIEEATKMLLSGLGVDLNDSNFKDTPARVARSYKEICSGLDNTEDQIDKILSTSFPSNGYDSMIFCSGIEVYSLCPHHLLPVTYEISIGYIPSETGRVLGASKLPRLAEILAKRPVLQEDFTLDIARYLEEINPIGVAVVVSGSHHCMRMRGVKQINSTFETSLMRGAFKEHAETRDEFFHLMAGRK